MTDALSIVAQIPRNVTDISMRAAILAAREHQATEARKAAAKALRDALAKTDAQQQANALKQEIRKATLETRKEIAEWESEAKRDPSVAVLIGERDIQADRARTLRGLLLAELNEHAQSLFPFAREVGL